MSYTISFEYRQNGSLTDVESAVLEDPTATFGAKRSDTNAVIAVAGTALVRQSLGTYTYEVLSPPAGIDIEYHVKYTVQGVVSYTEDHFTSTTLVSGRYCDRDHINRLFGTENVDSWLAFDDTQDSTELNERVSEAITQAEEFIDNFLAGTVVSEQVPFTVVPLQIREVASYLAGITLYEARGSLEADAIAGSPQHRYHSQRTRAYRILSMIASGDVRVTSTYSDSAPL